MSKISELSDGGAIQSGDTLIAVRSGGNVKVTYGGTTTANIDGGTIDGTVIGGSSAAAGTFTSITGTSANINGTVTADGLSVTNAVESEVQLNSGVGQNSQLRFAENGTNQWSIYHNASTNDLRLYDHDSATNRINFANNGDISFYEDTGTTAKFFWDASAESLGIGGTPDYNLHVTGVGDTIAAVTAGAASVAGLNLGNSTNKADGGIRYDNAADALILRASNAEAMRISSGNLLVGKTSSNFNVAGVEIRGSGELIVTRANDVLHLNRTGTDGNIASFRKDNVTVGSIGTEGDDLTIGTGDTGLQFRDASDAIRPFNITTNAARDAGIDLGRSSERFRDLYLSEGINLSADDGGGVGTNTIGFKHTINTAGYAAAIEASYGGDFRANLIFKINTSQANIAPIEVGRFDAGGNLLVGRSSAGAAATDNGHVFFGTGQHYIFSNATECVRFYETSGSGQQVGSISITSSATAFNTSSDERLKENITDANDAGNKIDAIKVRQYDWKADGLHQDYGMVAQELMTVAPEAVHQPEDPDEMMGVDYSKLVPMMLKEIQSLRARVAQLEGAN